MLCSFYFFNWLPHAACAILVPQPGIEPWAMAVKVLNSNCHGLCMDWKIIFRHEAEWENRIYNSGRHLEQHASSRASWWLLCASNQFYSLTTKFLLGALGDCLGCYREVCRVGHDWAQHRVGIFFLIWGQGTGAGWFRWVEAHDNNCCGARSVPGMTLVQGSTFVTLVKGFTPVTLV